MSGENAKAAAAASIHGGAADPLAELIAQQNDPQPAANVQELIDRETGKSAPIAFDEAIHETDGAGNPIKNLNGSFRVKRGRGSPRHRAQGNAGELPADLTGGQPESVDVAATPAAPPYGEAEAARDATLAVGTITGSLQGFFGPKWKPEAEEFDMMRSELAAYCLIHGGLGIPPWLGVAMAFGMYAGRRVELPGGLSAKIKGTIGGAAGAEETTEAAPDPIAREFPPTTIPPARSPVDARPQPVTRPSSAPPATSRPPMRSAA